MNIGVIGLAGPGKYALAHLLAKTAGDLLVYDRAGRKVPEQTGAKACAGAAELVTACDVILLALDSPEEQIALCNAVGGLIRQDQLFIDLTQISPGLAHKNANAMRRLGAFYLDCGVFAPPGLFEDKREANRESLPAFRPMKTQADDGILMFVGGNGEAYARALPLLRCIAPACRYMGPAGRGQAMRVMCGALAFRLQQQVERFAEMAGRFGVEKEDLEKSMRGFETIARPLAALEGGEPAFTWEDLLADAVMADEMERKAKKAADDFLNSSKE